MKLPNKYGSVHKIGGIVKRRKPWRVRISCGYEYNKETDSYKRMYKTLGYYETKQAALQALANYNSNPYDIDADKFTFAECYAKWSEEYFKRVVDQPRHAGCGGRARCASGRWCRTPPRGGRS